MSIFINPLSELGTADLQELLDDGAVENARLEFKLEVPTKDETLKKLSSFANTFGGFMVIGAKASSADGRLEDLPGVDAQPGYKQKVVQWCFDAVSPPLTVQVSDPIAAPAGNKKVCYVVCTAESDIAPHFLNGRKGVWVRTDEFSALFEARMADENELRHLFDRRRLVQERRSRLLQRARKRFDTYAAKMHTDAGGHRAKSGSRMELCVVPRFPTRPLSEQEKLTSLLRGANLPWRSVVFPRLKLDVISQYESAIILEPTGNVSIFEANVWGMLFYGTQIDKNESGNPGIHLPQFVGHVLLFIRHATGILQALGYSGPLLVETSLSSILGVPWLYTVHGTPSSDPGSELDDDVSFLVTTTTEALLEKADAVAIDVLRTVFFSVNLPDLVDKPPKLEELILRGYDYNAWGRPGRLRI
jgi:hypothetical protein